MGVSLLHGFTFARRLLSIYYKLKVSYLLNLVETLKCHFWLVYFIVIRCWCEYLLIPWINIISKFHMILFSLVHVIIIRCRKKNCLRKHLKCSDLKILVKKVVCTYLFYFKKWQKNYHFCINIKSMIKVICSTLL